MTLTLALTLTLAHRALVLPLLHDRLVTDACDENKRARTWASRLSGGWASSLSQRQITPQAAPTLTLTLNLISTGGRCRVARGSCGSRGTRPGWVRVRVRVRVGVEDTPWMGHALDRLGSGDGLGSGVGVENTPWISVRVENTPWIRVRVRVGVRANLDGVAQVAARATPQSLGYLPQLGRAVAARGHAQHSLLVGHLVRIRVRVRVRVSSALPPCWSPAVEWSRVESSRVEWVSRATRLARYTAPRCWVPHNPDTNVRCTEKSRRTLYTQALGSTLLLLLYPTTTTTTTATTRPAEASARSRTPPRAGRWR
eukprot:scaffold112502_cov45-Phaeocystis_antarctica.AAC.2